MIAAWLAAWMLGAPPAPTGPVSPKDPPSQSPVIAPTLLAPLDLPSAPPVRRDRAPIVQVQLTVGVDGIARDLLVVQSPGEPYTSLVLAALSRARFQPATRDGVPLAARILAPVLVGAAPAWTARERREPEPTPTVAAGVAGIVLERGTRRPVAGVAVRLGPSDNQRETFTDADGRFAFPDVPRGRVAIEVPFFGDEAARATVQVPGSVTLRITPESTQAYRTRIGDDRKTGSDAARIVIPVERAREVPGSSGDPLKVLEALPGVARPAAAGPGAGELSVRGSAPEDTRYYIDGMPLFQLYHFGNAYSVLQDAWIGDIDFRAGGYSTEYGDATGGMVNVTLADLPQDGVHGHGDVNIYHAAGLVTVPVSKAWTLGAAARRSWIDAILSGIDGGDGGFRFTTAPRYYDYQVRADFRPDPGTTLRLLVFGSDDNLVVFGGSPDPADASGGNFALARSFHQIQGTLATQLADDLQLKLGLATSYQHLRVAPGVNDFQLAFCPLSLRADLDWRASRNLRVRGGLYGEVSRFKVELALPRPTKEGQVQLPTAIKEVLNATEEGYSGRLDLWGEAQLALSPEFALLGGVRVASWLGGFERVAPDARLSFSWTPNATTTVEISGGLNHEAPAPDETADSIGNPKLLPERAAYVNLSVEQRFGDLLSVELQGFYKDLGDLVVNTAGVAQGPDAVPYDNAGTGTIVGGEALIRLRHPIVDAWIAYTLSRSVRRDRPSQPERLFSYDQTHVLALVAGVQLGRGWRVGTRLRYATGNPFTPLEPAYFDAGSDSWVPRAAAPALSARSAGFFQLDLRVDKTWIFDAWKLDLYLELNNATNQSNIEAIRYSRDYQKRDDIKSLGLTPSLGVRGVF